MRRSIETTLYILHCCELFIPEKVFSASRLHSLYCLIHVNMSDYSEDNLYNCPLQNTFQCTGCHCIVCCGRSECTVPLLYPALTHSATLRIYSIQYIIMLLEPIHRAKMICQHWMLEFLFPLLKCKSSQVSCSLADLALDRFHWDRKTHFWVVLSFLWALT